MYRFSIYPTTPAWFSLPKACICSKGGGEEPLEVWQRLQALGATCTRGPSDMALAAVDPQSLVPIDDEQRRQARAFAQTRAAIGDLVAERLRRLPEQHRIPLIDGREVLMVHGSPADPGRELSHDLEDEEMLALLDDDPADIVICGSTHVPFQRSVGEYHIVNVGSVGAAPITASRAVRVSSKSPGARLSGRTPPRAAV